MNTSRSSTAPVAAIAALLLLVTAVVADAQARIGVTTDVAPIFLRPDASLTPLRTAAVGTTVTVIGTAGDWANVEFNDPQLGTRVGWLLRELLSMPSGSVPEAISVPMDLSASPSHAGTPVPRRPPGTGRPRLFIERVEGTDFHVFMAAAMSKKGAPVDVTVDRAAADLVLTASAIEVDKQSTGSKWVRCLFAYCAGIEDRSNVSVQVVDRAGLVRWSYAVNKGRGQQKNKQSMAEAIAKHFKNNFDTMR